MGSRRKTFQSLPQLVPRPTSLTSADTSKASLEKYYDISSKFRRFKRFCWNRQEKTYCSRSGKSWAKILFFYFVYLSFILGSFFLMLGLATNYIRKNHPKPLIEKRSITPGQHCPGVAFVPNIENEKSPLIWYTNRGDEGHFSRYVKEIDYFLQVYRLAESRSATFTNCSMGRRSSRPCLFARNQLGPCGRSDYGYSEFKPCIYIKINKLNSWRPEYFVEESEIPKAMSEGLKRTILHSPNKKKMWLECQGFYPHDEEHIGTISYYPDQSFLADFFPYSHEHDYLSPLVAIKFDNVKRGYIINVRCTVWAKNLESLDAKYHSTDLQLYLALT